MALFIALAAGCAGPPIGEARDAVLLEWLQRDNAVWLGRDPRLLAGKYERMAGDPYDFMRGTAGLFHEDLQRLSGERVDLGYAKEADSASVLILGDPHPENLSTFLPEDGPGPAEGERVPDLVVAWADMDAATRGPWIADVRRAAQGLLLFVHAMEGCDPACQEGAVRGLAEGYDRGVRAAAAGESTFRLQTSLVGGPFVQDLIDEAQEEGAERKRLEDNTELVDGARVFATLDELPESGRGLLRPTAAERALADRILEGYAAQQEGPFRVLDVARRYGQGVSSWPATRFVVLWDEGDDGPDDDRLLNVREVLDAPLVPGPGQPASAPWRSNGARLVEASRTLWPQPDLDPRLGAVDDGPTSYKLLSYTSWYQGLDHGKAEEVWSDGDADAVDVTGFGRGVGGALALAHCRGTTAAGAPACPAILADLGSDPEALGEALLRVAFADRDRTLDDHARFVRLLESEGPLLGADTYAELPR